MENWARVMRVAASSGSLPSLHHPLSKRFPTISAHEVGLISADLLMRASTETDLPSIVHAEGPRRYTPIDVADAMAKVLGRDVVAYELARQDWHAILRGAGLSDSGAQLVTELYDAHNQGLIDAERGSEVVIGTIELTDALQALVSHGATP
jgi:NAD(P)H dehydrogenase (quinone)